AYELDHAAALVYCLSKPNALGCIPRIGFSGVPSASSASAFTVTASQVINQKSGIFFYGTNGRAATPFQGGLKCAASPTIRSDPMFSGGSAAGVDCSGELALDFNAWIQSGADP